MILSKYRVLVLFHNNYLDVQGSTISLKHRVLAINPNDLFPSGLLLFKSRTFRNKMILPYLNFKTGFSYKTSFLYSLQYFETTISCPKLTSLFSLSHATKCHALDFYLTSGLTLGKVIWRGKCTGNNNNNSNNKTSKQKTNKQKTETKQ